MRALALLLALVACESPGAQGSSAAEAGPDGARAPSGGDSGGESCEPSPGGAVCMMFAFRNPGVPPQAMSEAPWRCPNPSEPGRVCFLYSFDLRSEPAWCCVSGE